MSINEASKAQAWSVPGRNRCWLTEASIAAPSIPDLLVAATAEISGLTVLALDKDFELIAQILGQPIERLRLTT